MVYKPAVWQTQSRSIAFIPIKLFDGLPIIKQRDVEAHLKHTLKRCKGKKMFFRKNVNAFREEFPAYNARIYEASLQSVP